VQAVATFAGPAGALSKSRPLTLRRVTKRRG
jgi:hypothetical protein